MAEDFHRVPIKKFPRHVQKNETVEQKFWKSFEFPTVVKEYTAINHVDFCNVKPYNCVVTCSGKIQIFSPFTNEVKRTYSRSKENYYGTEYRSDGKLLVTGGESGLVQILDVASRAILRNFRGHKKPAHVCCFGKEPAQVFSASDDKTLRCWDLASQKEVLTIKAHKDFVRCGCINETNTNQFVTGSYDHLVKIWDCRSAAVTMDMDHGAPVECVLMHSNGSICLSAGGNYIKVWDMLSGGKLFHQFSSHQKTITTIRYDDECKTLFSGSLDRHIKLYSTIDYSEIANIDYPSPILAMDISKDGNHLTVGMSDGAISLRHRAKPKSGETPKKKLKQFQPGTYLYRIRNQLRKPDEDSLVVAEEKRHKEAPADKFLRKFEYHQALDQVIMTDNQSPKYVLSVILELSRRDALEIALSNRDTESLSRIIKFLEKHITNPSYSKILIPVASLLLDMYSGLIGQDFILDKSLRKMRMILSDDFKNREEIIKLGGALEQIFSMATPPPSSKSICPYIDSADFTSVHGETDTPTAEPNLGGNNNMDVTSCNDVIKSLTNGHAAEHEFDSSRSEERL